MSINKNSNTSYYLNSRPPIVNDLSEDELLAKKFGPKDRRRRANLFMNDEGQISKISPITQPLEPRDDFTMVVPREIRSSASMVTDPEARAEQRREDYEAKLDSLENVEDKSFEKWKDDNRISDYHEITTVGESGTFSGQQNYEALQRKIAMEEARQQQHQRYLDSLNRTNNRLGASGGGKNNRRFY